MSRLINVLLDAPRAAELEWLQCAISKRQPMLPGTTDLDEIFALGMQAAWLRLSKGERIGPATERVLSEHYELGN